MFRFKERVFLKKNGWFVWESSWDMFRPISAFVWNGKSYGIEDSLYTKDPFSELFGFGSPEMKDICSKLTDEYLGDIENAPTVREACIGAPIWLRDRFVVTQPEYVNTWRTHLRAIGCRARTCRGQPRGKKFTKRTLR
jgi:hypothetical protein